MPDSGDTPEPIANGPWTPKELIIVERTRKCPGTPLPLWTSLNLTLWSWHSWSHPSGTNLHPGLPQLGDVAASCLRGVVVTD